MPKESRNPPNNLGYHQDSREVQDEGRVKVERTDNAVDD